jgi:hypothetical protein
MDDRSTISWMIMGGPRHDQHSQAEIDHLLAVREQQLERKLARSGGRFARLVGFVDAWTARPAKAMTADFCSVEPCTAA